MVGVILCVILFFGILFSTIDFLPSYIDVGRYETALSLSMLLPLFMGLILFRQYSYYKQGYDGEKQVTKTLNSALNDEYHLINDVNLSDGQ